MTKSIAAASAASRVGAVHRLDQEMAKSQPSSVGGIDPRLRPDQLELVARALHHLGARLGADADPVDPRRRRQVPLVSTAISKPRAWSASISGGVELEHRLAAGDHDQRPLALAPQRVDLRRPAPRPRSGRHSRHPVPTKSVSQKLQCAVGAVLLAAGPQIAAGEAQEDGAPPGLHPLALQGQEDLLDRVAHAPRRRRSVIGRIGDARLGEAPGAQPAGIAQAAMPAVGRRIVAGPAHARRRARAAPPRATMSALVMSISGVWTVKRVALDARLGGEVRHRLERGDEFRAGNRDSPNNRAR